MKTLILLFFSFTFLNFHAQSIKLSEIINLLPKDIDFCDTWVLKKGFISRPDENAKDENCEYFLAYALKTNLTVDIAFYKCIYNGNLPNVSLRTRSEQEYIAYKEEAKALGFKYKETIMSEKGKLIDYTLERDGLKYQLSIGTTNYSEFNLYEITLSSVDL
jgi:hypothetical protein